MIAGIPARHENMSKFTLIAGRRISHRRSVNTLSDKP
jgi:hypothetical protein